MKRQFTVTDGKHTAKVEVSWAEESRYSVAHYNAYILVPFQSGKVYNLFVYDEAKIDEAINTATSYAKDDLATCTTF